MAFGRSRTLTGTRSVWCSRGHVFKSWPQLAEERAHAMRCRKAVLDGEIVCLDEQVRSRFTNLLSPRAAVIQWPSICRLDGKDLQLLALHERKRRLRGVVPRVESRVR